VATAINKSRSSDHPVPAILFDSSGWSNMFGTQAIGPQNGPHCTVINIPHEYKMVMKECRIRLSYDDQMV
jgi:hypothetical protein